MDLSAPMAPLEVAPGANAHSRHATRQDCLGPRGPKEARPWPIRFVAPIDAGPREIHEGDPPQARSAPGCPPENRSPRSRHGQPQSQTLANPVESLRGHGAPGLACGRPATAAERLSDWTHPQKSLPVGRLGRASTSKLGTNSHHHLPDSCSSQIKCETPMRKPLENKRADFRP